MQIFYIIIHYTKWFIDLEDDLNLYNWYVLDGLLCGDLCLVNMRQNEYSLEKNTYKNINYIRKQDKKYKKSHPCDYRFHLFVKLQIIHIDNKVATTMYEKRKQNIILQNMDSYFYFNEIRKKKLEEIVKSFN